MKKIIIAILALVLIVGGIFFASGKMRQGDAPQQTPIVAKAKNYETLVAGAKLLKEVSVGNPPRGVQVIAAKVGKDAKGIYGMIGPSVERGSSIGLHKQTKLYLGQSVPVYAFPKNADDKSAVRKVGTVSLVALGDSDGEQTVTLALKVDEK